MSASLTLIERRKRELCQHSDRISTINFGLERQVCLECGSVRMRKAADAEPGTLFRVPHPISQSQS